MNKTGWEKQTKSRMIFAGLKVFMLLSSSKNVFPFFPFLKNFQGLHIYTRILFGVLLTNWSELEFIIWGRNKGLL